MTFLIESFKKFFLDGNFTGMSWIDETVKTGGNTFTVFKCK